MDVTQIGDTVMDALEATAVKAVEASIISSVPFLGIPPFSFLLNMAVNFILNIAKTKIEVAAYIAYSTAVVNKQASDLNNAAKEQVDAELSGDPNAIAKAIQDRIDAARKLGHLNNVN